MDKESRIALFSQQLNWITDPALNRFAQHLLEKFPDYFFSTPASSSGNYHPKSDLGKDGLIRHTKNVMTIFHLLTHADADRWYGWTDMAELIDRDQNISECLVALLVHDAWKQGNPATGHTIHEHPALASQFVLDEAAGFPDLDPASVKRIANCVLCHSGKWNISKFSPIMLPTPDSYQERLVHLCDFLASRKQINIDLDSIVSIS